MTDNVQVNIGEVEFNEKHERVTDLKRLVDLSQSSGYQKNLKPWLLNIALYPEIQKVESKTSDEAMKNEAKRLERFKTVEKILHYIDSANKRLMKKG